MTRDQAEHLVDMLCEYMRTCNSVPHKVSLTEDPQHQEDAAKWARRILEASGRDDHCGCILCRS